MVKILVLAVLVAIVLAPMARADPNSYFLECMTEHGMVITNTSKTIDLGIRIQNDERAGMSASQIIWNLENRWGVTPLEATTVVNCATATLAYG